MTNLQDYENESWDEWDNGTLGQSAEYAKISEALDEVMIDEALELQSISIRMPKGLLDDLKRIATIHSTGYQPLMKQVLQRFVTCEMKQILRDTADKAKARSVIESEKLMSNEPMKKTG